MNEVCNGLVKEGSERTETREKASTLNADSAAPDGTEGAFLPSVKTEGGGGLQSCRR